MRGVLVMSTDSNQKTDDKKMKSDDVVIDNKTAEDIVSEKMQEDDSVAENNTSEDDLSTGDSSEKPSEIESLQKQLEDQKVLFKEAQEKTLRTLAEFENFKRRKEQEKEDAIKFSLKTFFESFIPVLDSFDQAENIFKELGEESKALKDGFQLIQQQLHTLLEKNGVVKIESKNQVFDPNLHQAVMQEESDTVASQTIIKVMQEGYRYHDRVLRPAMVVVAI